ncbi:LamG domain-containing protein [Planctomycetota bacterium]
MSKTSHIVFLLAVLGFAVAIPAANISWIGENADANGLGFWDDSGNWSSDVLPTMDDEVRLYQSNTTIVVDDWDPNIVKEAGTIRLGWGTGHGPNVTLVINSAEEDGSGGILTTNEIRISSRGSKNSKLQVDAGHLNINGGLRTGRDNDATAFIEINGGRVDCLSMNLTEREGYYSEAGLTMNGGELNVDGALTTSGLPGISFLHLNGGTIRIGSLGVREDFTLDFNGGELVLNGDQSSLMTQLASAKQITVGGINAERGGLSVAYDAEADETTIMGDPSLVNLNQAWKPAPLGDGIDINTGVLSWSAGDVTAVTQGHDVYFGIDSNAVTNETVNNIFGTYLGRVDANEIDITADLELGQAYYWRVDQRDDAGAVTKGNLWSFTLVTSLLVDNFESYDGNSPNEIFETWIDGYDVPENGMMVGQAFAPYVEQSVVKQGAQSMPLFYDNNDVVLSSEAKRSFDEPQNWTRHSIKSLSLFFHGDPNNTFDQIYLKINDVKVAYDLAIPHLQTAQWQPWIINLAAVDVAVLANVTSVTIGVDGGESGKLYIDNIRLYPLEAELVTAVGPDANGLLAEYTFEGNYEDSSGNDYHGTPKGDAQIINDPVVGQVMHLGGNFGGMTLPQIGEFEQGTVVMWVNSAIDPSTAPYTRLSCYRTHGWSSGDVRFSLLDSGRFSFGGHSIGGAMGGTVVSANEWYLVAITRSDTQTALWLNGLQENTGGIGSRKTFFLEGMIGAFDQGGSGVITEEFIGMIDEVRIYDRALSQAEFMGLAGRTDTVYKPF